MILTLGTEIEESDRRTAVMQHADITLKAYDNDETKLDAKIENGDNLAITWLQNDAPKRELITLSNILTAWLICSGIGGTENTERCRRLKDMAKDITESVNNKGSAQNASSMGFSMHPNGGLF